MRHWLWVWSLKIASDQGQECLEFFPGLLQKDIGDRLSLDELRIEVNQTTQNAQLVLGRNLSLLGRPLYLRYTTDFGKSSQLLQFQWQISKHFQVQTESGIQDAQSVKGGDVFFTWNY